LIGGNFDEAIVGFGNEAIGDESDVVGRVSGAVGRAYDGLVPMACKP